MKNKHITAVFVLVMCIILSTVGFADAESGFPWGMNKDAVVEKMGKSGEIDTSTSAGNTLLRYYGEHVSEFEASLVFAFRNDSLFAKMYGIDDDASKMKYNYLAEALDIKYGFSNDTPSIVVDCFGVMGLELDESILSLGKSAGMISYKTWTPTEDMNIVLCGIYTEDTKITALFYIQPKDQISDKQYNFDGL